MASSSLGKNSLFNPETFVEETKADVGEFYRIKMEMLSSPLELKNFSGRLLSLVTLQERLSKRSASFLLAEEASEQLATILLKEIATIVETKLIAEEKEIKASSSSTSSPRATYNQVIVALNAMLRCAKNATLERMSLVQTYIETSQCFSPENRHVLSYLLDK